MSKHGECFIISWSIKKQLERLFQKGLELSIDGRVSRFKNAEAFDVMLRARVDVSREELTYLGGLTDDELVDQLDSNNAILQRVLSLHLMGLETHDGVDAVWKDMDISILHEDREWQSLLFALGDESAVPSAYREKALLRYLEYLKSRKEVVQEFIRQRDRKGRLGLNKPVAELETPSENSISEMSLDEKTLVSMTEGIEYARLPHGKSVSVAVPEGEYISIYLARQRIRIKAGEEPAIMDDKGIVIPIKRGLSVIGRSRKCDVILDASPSEVSRKHLVIETSGDDKLRLTDMSSRGTYVPTTKIR
ncbi:MAG: FHA domain-containing protein [Gammaproteobacteria bacterium]|nr:FHA domain-containing protein [Gammaproteobacteria bacterium]